MIEISRSHVSGLLVLFAMAAIPAFAAPTPLPTMTGPVTGPGDPYPSLQRVPAGTSLTDHKYVVKEYFISGTAAGKPYTTRILVREPEDPKKFSGIAVAEPMHSSGNSWMFYFTRIYMMDHGNISVEIAPQKASTESIIVASNKERYSKISIPDAAQANEIIAQAGALLKSNLPNGPLPGLRVRHLFLMGTSQSAGTVRGFMAVHGNWRMPDGGPIFDGYYVTSTGGANQVVKVDVPVIQIATMTEVNAGSATGNPYRRPDGDDAGDQFRLYEMAGMPHNDSRENPSYDPNPCMQPVTTFPDGAMMAMGLHHLVEWVDHHKVPPRADRIVVDPESKKIALDANGNARGGVRNTYVDVPFAKYSVPNSTGPNPTAQVRLYCSIAAVETPLSPEQMHALYKDQKDYRHRVDQRLKELTKEGWFLPEYAYQVTADEEKVRIP